MLHTFDNSEKSLSRRLERERQMQIMEAASAGAGFSEQDLHNAGIDDSSMSMSDHDAPRGSIGLANYFLTENSREKRLTRLKELISTLRTFMFDKYLEIAIFVTLLFFLTIIAGLVTTEKKLMLGPKSERHEAIKEHIIQMGLANEDDLNSRTPQFNGLNWIANEDEAQLDIHHEAFSQRYALSVIYYAMNLGPSKWESRLNWMTDKGICSWYGIECVRNDDELVQYDDNRDVVVLNLTSNGMIGTIPTEIGLLRNLTILDVADNEIGGLIPSEIFKLQELVKLYLGSNKIVGTIPNEVLLLNNLANLYLESNQLTGSIPENIGDMKSLEGLSLYKNKLQGSIPRSIGLLKNLYVCYLDNNDLTGTIPPEIGSLLSLTDFRLRKNKLVGNIPKQIGGLESLETFYADNNMLSSRCNKNMLPLY